MTAPLHPAVRRRLAAAAPPVPAHDVMLRPLGGGALILSATEQDFIGALLADLGSDGWRHALAARAGTAPGSDGRYPFGRRGRDGRLELSPPIHRRFHLVVLEAACREPGSPRLDPKAIAGMGFVLRRHGRTGPEGWMRAGPLPRGWRGLGGAFEADPDPALRHPGRPAAAGTLEALLARRRGATAPLAEEVHPLFLAPPHLCAKLGRTVVYGVVPTASAEASEAPTALPNYAALPADEAAAIRQHLSGYLKARPAMAMPLPGALLDPAWPPLDTHPEPQMKAFGLFLQQLAIELGAFEPAPAARALMALLGRIRLPLQRDEQHRVVRDIAASDFLSAARDVLLARKPNTGNATMPLAWPAVSAADGEALTAAALACLGARFAQLVPRTPKFERDDDLYSVRAFVRVRTHAHCPPKLWWSGSSELFRILPWWAADAPPARVSLPDLSDRQVLASLKPGVSFAVPPALANLLDVDPKKLREGDASGAGSLDIAWLCGFSIPIITICAFIVLHIFLRLLDLIFHWMPFLKICIPLPKRR